MNNKNLEYLKEQMKRLGFPLRVAEQVSQNAGMNSESFHVYYSQNLKDDHLMYDLQFTKQNNSYELNQYELTLKHIPIPSAIIGGIDTISLDNELNIVDSLYDKFLVVNTEGKMTKEEYDEGINLISEANSRLTKLMEIEEGKNVAKVLRYKYCPQSEYEKFFTDYVEMQRVYEHKQTFPAAGKEACSIIDAYQTLRSNTIDSTAKSILNAHSISDEALAQINSSLVEGCNWMAYNTASYQLDRHDVHMFRHRHEANEFVQNNISEFDSFHVIKATHVVNLLKQMHWEQPNTFSDKINNKQRENQLVFLGNNEALRLHLEKLGFGNKLNEAISFYESYPQAHFQLPVRERNEKEAIDYWLRFEKSDNTRNYQLTGYDATLRIYPEIPDTIIIGINTGKLDEAMKQFDWSLDHHTEALIDELLQTKAGRQELKSLDNILNDINKLHHSPEGKEIAEKLMFKYWSAGPYEPNECSLKDMQQQYQFTYTVSAKTMLPKSVVYESLKATAEETILNQTTSITQTTTFMNQKNFDYLKDQVKFTGFGDALENELKEKMQKQTTEFQILHTAKFGNDTADATLHFRKSDQSDMYFFNRYNLSLKQEQSGDVVDQTFYINKANNITLKEAYNLMSGRSINKDLTNKEGQVYNAWMQMDFKETDGSGNYKIKHYHQNYGFELEKVLASHPIKELGNEQDKSRLIDSLNKGNRQSVIFIQNGNEQKHFIEANPKFKSINVYDGNMQRIVNKQGKGERETQGEANGAKQDVKKERQMQNDGDDGPEIPKAVKSRKRKQGQNI